MTPLQDNPIPLFILLPGGKLGSALRRGALIHLPDQRIINTNAQNTQPQHIGIDSITPCNVTHITG